MFTLTVATTGTGSVTSDPAGISCGATCTMEVAAGTVVTLTGVPERDTAVAWSGACTGTGPCQVTVNAATSVSAAFTCPSGSATFNYSGAVQTLTRPACVTALTVDARGGAGGIAFGTAANIANSVSGGRTQATVPVTPTDVITVSVGGAGGNAASSTSGAGGFGGGGAGAHRTGDPQSGGGGGGASDVLRNGTKVVVAGGAGGSASCGGSPYDGGVGGGLFGGTPTTGCAIGTSTATTATGGTQTMGGAGGFYSGYCTAASGSLGAGAPGCGETGGGGGGGGYYGGGGGAWNGGGGGSSYTAADVIAVTHTPAFQAGNGQVIISW